MKCERCGGSGKTRTERAGRRLKGGAQIIHTSDVHDCTACNGSGQQPEAPAPAAPAELAAKLTALAIVHQEYAPTLLEAAEQLQRQAAVCEAAREYKRVCDEAGVLEWLQRLDEADAASDPGWAEDDGDDDDPAEWPSTEYTAAQDKLEAALAALEATDGR